MRLDRRRVYAAVTAVAAVVYLGALWNGFALDDHPIIQLNPLTHSWSGIWRAFAHSYWPEAAGGEFYRPLPIASYALDGTLTTGATWWFHLVNLLWHIAVSVAVAMLAGHWRGEKGGLVAGLLFAVHPVHVEAVANVIGRAEVMAALFGLLAVYSALAWRSVAWSTAFLVLGMLCKENAAVVPGLVVWGWILGLDRPPRPRMAAFVAAWVAAIAACFTARWFVLHGYMGRGDLAQFIGADFMSTRLTAVAGLADAARLLVFPLHLRIDFSPAERTLVTSPLDPRFLAGLGYTVGLVALLILAWRRGRTMEAFGLGWIAIAYLPVANLLVPIGVLIADRALYFPSVGLALAAGAWLSRLQPARGTIIVSVLVAAGALRTALRVPVWRNDNSVTLSILEDSPGSYLGPQFTASILLRAGKAAPALGYYRDATAIYPYDPRNLLGAADAALTLGRRPAADSFFAQADRLCGRCRMHYITEADLARARGDSAVADTLLARLRRLDQ